MGEREAWRVKGRQEEATSLKLSQQDFRTSHTLSLQRLTNSASWGGAIVIRLANLQY